MAGNRLGDGYGFVLLYTVFDEVGEGFGMGFNGGEDGECFFDNDDDDGDGGGHLLGFGDT